MLMVWARFTNRPIYDSIRTCDVGLSQRGLCPVAQKPILEDRESDQAVAYFFSANFGLASPPSIALRAPYSEQFVDGLVVHCRRALPGRSIFVARHRWLKSALVSHHATAVADQSLDKITFFKSG